MHSTWNFYSRKILTRQTNPEVFHSTAHEIIWAPTGLTPVISEAPYIQKHNIFGNFCDMMKIQCLSCYLMGEPSKSDNIWRRFYFFLLNFLDFTRFLLIFALNLLTSSLFLNFLIFFSENIDGNEHSCQNLWLLQFSFRKYQGNAILHYPPPKMGFGEPPKIGLIGTSGHQKAHFP